MTGNQASPAPPEVPAAQAATARPHGPAGRHAVGYWPADLLVAAVRKKTALYAPLLAGGAMAAVLAMALPATASPVTGHDATSAGSISAILKHGGKVSCTAASLAAGASMTVTIKVTATTLGTVSDAAKATASKVTADTDDSGTASTTVHATWQ